MQLLLMRRDPSPKWSANTPIFVDDPHSGVLLAIEGG